MKYQHLFVKAYLAFAVVLFLLLTAVSCQQKQEKPWQYYGEATAEQAKPAAPAQATP